jgi:hypothetical protein
MKPLVALRRPLVIGHALRDNVTVAAMLIPAARLAGPRWNGKKKAPKQRVHADHLLSNLYLTLSTSLALFVR